MKKIVIFVLIFFSIFFLFSETQAVWDSGGVGNEDLGGQPNQTPDITEPTQPDFVNTGMIEGEIDSQFGLPPGSLGTYDDDPSINWEKDKYGMVYAEGAGLQKANPKMVVLSVVQMVLGFLGIIFLIIVIYAGFKWMTAGGNEENSKAAIKMIYSGVIGLAIIMSALTITRFVVSNLSQAISPISIEGDQVGQDGWFW